MTIFVGDKHRSMALQATWSSNHQDAAVYAVAIEKENDCMTVMVSCSDDQNTLWCEVGDTKLERYR